MILRSDPQIHCTAQGTCTIVDYSSCPGWIVNMWYLLHHGKCFCAPSRKVVLDWAILKSRFAESRPSLLHSMTAWQHTTNGQIYRFSFSKHYFGRAYLYYTWVIITYTLTWYVQSSAFHKIEFTLRWSETVCPYLSGHKDAAPVFPSVYLVFLCSSSKVTLFIQS